MQIYDNTKFHILQYEVLHKLFPSNLYNLIFSSAAAFWSVGSLPGRNTMRRLPLRSPPRMRGKVIVRSRNAVQIGITPAYAGKSARILKRRTEKRDHPRVCGEKLKFGTNVTKNPGSPPRVRGKGIVHVFVPEKLGITPAYAGKRMLYARAVRRDRDHPRVCGEKESCQKIQKTTLGSPPRMRGKGCYMQELSGETGITPAYAGKSGPCPDRVPPAGDHPRVCGEKSQSTSASPRALGSPPRMRGKGVKQSNSRIRMGITPAYAGKSCIYRSTTSISWDHPRVCGEKSFKTSTSCWSKGSPPRMRGKGIQPCNQWVRVGITPAYAGKRYEEMLQQAGR